MSGRPDRKVALGPDCSIFCSLLYLSPKQIAPSHAYRLADLRSYNHFLVASVAGLKFM